LKSEEPEFEGPRFASRRLAGLRRSTAARLPKLQVRAEWSGGSPRFQPVRKLLEQLPQAASRRTCRRSGSHPNSHCRNERSATGPLLISIYSLRYLEHSLQYEDQRSSCGDGRLVRPATAKPSGPTPHYKQLIQSGPTLLVRQPKSAGTNCGERASKLSPGYRRSRPSCNL
jgi:hypothetical protein